MNTPAHVIFALAAFGKPNRTAVTTAAVVGALLPDMSLYLMAGVSLFVLNIPPEIVFGELYFSPTWQFIFGIDNSLIIWAGIFAGALWWKSAWGVALAGSALLHIGLDLFLHHDDGRPHFWPVSDWVFASPLSYWDRNHYAGIIAPLEIGICFALCVWMWVRFVSLPMRALILILAVLEITPAFLWITMQLN